MGILSNNSWLKPAIQQLLWVYLRFLVRIKKAKSSQRKVPRLSLIPMDNVQIPFQNHTKPLAIYVSKSIWLRSSVLPKLVIFPAYPRRPTNRILLNLFILIFRSCREGLGKPWKFIVKINVQLSQRTYCRHVNVGNPLFQDEALHGRFFRLNGPV